MKPTGTLTVIYGPMFSGKTSSLIRIAQEEKSQGNSLMIFNSIKDQRYGVNQLTSHDGIAVSAILVQKSAQISSNVHQAIDTILIDEGQFFDDELPATCIFLRARGKRVVVAGLDRDFRGEPFGPIAILTASADQVIELHARCTVCGGPAHLTQRLVNGKPAHYNDPIVITGAAELYEPRCSRHHCVIGSP